MRPTAVLVGTVVNKEDNNEEEPPCFFKYKKTIYILNSFLGYRQFSGKDYPATGCIMQFVCIEA